MTTHNNVVQPQISPQPIVVEDAATAASPATPVQLPFGAVTGPPVAESQAWSRIPAELRNRPQWCLARPPEKRPLQADGNAASSTDPNTWTDFETATRAAGSKGWHVGYMLSAGDPFTCVDLDVKSDAHPEEFTTIIEYFDSYTEHSRSGKGFHVWVEGKIGQGKRLGPVEVYSQERFIICTGNVVRDRPIVNREGKLKDWVGEWKGRYPSHSELDLSLMTGLARAFRMSGGGQREKAQRPDYIKRTAEQAVEIDESDASSVEHGRVMAEALLANWKQKRLLQLYDDDGLRLEFLPQRWLVKGIMPDTGVGTIFGQSGSFKSFLALDLLAHVANCQSWFGRRVKGAPTVYVPFEGQGGIPKRVEAWRRAHIGAPTNMRFIMAPINLRNKEDRDRLVDTLIQKGWAGGVLCIDTLAQAGPGIDENTSQGMGEMIAIFQELQRWLGGVVLVVHHSGKDQSRGMRGWSGLRGALDFSIECFKAEGDAKLDGHFRLDKVKDGEEGPVFDFRMSIHVLGQDEDGDVITSLVPNPMQREPAKNAATKSAEDDDFVEAWIRTEMQGGTRPTARSLEAQLVAMKAQRSMSRDRIRYAVARLEAAGKLDRAEGGPRGQTWLRSIDVPNG